uniref:Transposase n=1 Tax=Steinernema glaseri TaxID=37863 RepID=A0A1I8ADD1_9BILA
MIMGILGIEHTDRKAITTAFPGKLTITEEFMSTCQVGLHAEKDIVADAFEYLLTFAWSQKNPPGCILHTDAMTMSHKWSWYNQLIDLRTG